MIYIKARVFSDALIELPDGRKDSLSKEQLDNFEGKEFTIVNTGLYGIFYPKTTGSLGKVKFEKNGYIIGHIDNEVIEDLLKRGSTIYLIGCNDENVQLSSYPIFPETEPIQELGFTEVTQKIIDPVL